MDEARMHELEAKVAELTAMVERLSADRSTPAAASALAIDSVESPVPAASSRRHLLRNAAIAAGGAVAATVAGSSLPAAAEGVDDLQLGIVNTIDRKTTANFTPGATTGGNAFLFQGGTTYVTNESTIPSVLAGWTTLPAYPNGLYGFTTQNGSAVVGVGSGASSIGVRALGVKAHLALTPNGAAAPSRTDSHGVGEVIEDGEGDLWLCVGAGTPGTWRKLAGPASAGAFHAIAPLRVYDSRLPLQPANGRLVSLQSRVLSIADARDQTTGEVTVANVVPAGATAIVCNLTVTDTTGPFGGFLSIVPGDATLPSGSSINWFGVNQNLANGITVKVDATRQVRVFAGGGGNPATHFIIDVNGYFR